MTLREAVPALFPEGRPCRNLGRPVCLVGVFKTDTATNPHMSSPGSGRIRMCAECAVAVEAQGLAAGYRVRVEGLWEMEEYTPEPLTAR